MDILSLSYYLVANYSTHMSNLTPMKLQKLLYYIKAWSLVAGKPIVNAPFLKWTYGPVNPEIYSEYKSFGKDPISPSAEALMCDENALSREDRKFVNFILYNYGNYNAYTLSEMTHKEDPWLMTADNMVISDEIIINYYKSQSFARNFPLDTAKPFFPLQDNNFHLFVFDMDPSDVKILEQYTSYDDYKNKRQRIKKELADKLKKIA